MATRGKLTLMFAFCIKHSKFFEQQLSTFLNVDKSSFKLRSISTQRIRKFRFVKFDQLIASFFLNTKEGVKFLKKWNKALRTEFPNDHSFSFFSGFSKTNRTTKSGNDPREDGILGIPNLKSYYIIFTSVFSFISPMLNPKATFSICKSGEVSKIRFRWIYAFMKTFNFVKFYFSDQVAHVNILFYFFYEIISREKFYGRNGNSFIWDDRDSQRDEKKARCLFANNEILNFISNQKSLFCFYSPQKGIFSIRSFFRSFRERSSKFLREIFNYIPINRANLYRILINQNVIRFLSIGPDVKTAVSIYISRKISKFMFHDMEYTGKHTLSQRPQRLTG